MLNRTLPPPAEPIRNFTIEKARSSALENKVPLHTVDAGDHDILQLEIILKSGKWFEETMGESYFTSKMLTEGTTSRSSLEISEFFEFYGVQFQVSPGMDYTSIVTLCLNKHFETILPVIQDCIFLSNFPEKEIRILKDQQIQQIRVNNEKGSYLASKEFKKLLFGPTHPYGTSLDIDDIGDHINNDLLRNFHERHLIRGMELILTGKETGKYSDMLNAPFGKSPVKEPGTPTAAGNAIAEKPREVIIHRPKFLQSSIRYGRKMISKSHPDYPAFLVLNELLGGFFGSRLMKNIREEKGYTYGIHSSVLHYLYESYFAITADVVREFTRKTIEEINREIIRLQTEPVGSEELETVKNYMLGGFLSSLETSFSLAEKFKAVYLHGLGYDYYDRYLSTVRNVTAVELMDLAKKYLRPEDFSLVIAGEDN